ncbi:hypothetical protein ACHWQZ_G007191 [Mnemiopsis leidyi]
MSWITWACVRRGACGNVNRCHGRLVDQLLMNGFSRYINLTMKHKSIAFDSSCLLSPSTLKDTRKMPKDTASHTAWICQKSRPPTKCPSHAYLTLEDNLLSLGAKPHWHPADPSVSEKSKVIKSLKGKAAEQPLAVTQNLISEEHLLSVFRVLLQS